MKRPKATSPSWEFALGLSSMDADLLLSPELLVSDDERVLQVARERLRNVLEFSIRQDELRQSPVLPVVALSLAFGGGKEIQRKARNALDAFADLVRHVRSLTSDLARKTEFMKRLYDVERYRARSTAIHGRMYSDTSAPRFEICFQVELKRSLLDKLEEVLREPQDCPCEPDTCKPRPKYESLGLLFRSSGLDAEKLGQLTQCLDRVLAAPDRQFTIDALVFRDHEFQNREFASLTHLMTKNDIYNLKELIVENAKRTTMQVKAGSASALRGFIAATIDVSKRTSSLE